MAVGNRHIGMSMTQDIPEAGLRPVVGSVVAGFPSPAEQYVEPPLDINAYLIKRREATFLMHVDGDSMRDAAILDKDVIVVDRSLRPASGDIIVASVDGDFTVKYYRKDKDGVRLEPANPDFPVIRLKPGQQMQYFGKVIGVVRKMG